MAAVIVAVYQPQLRRFMGRYTGEGRARVLTLECCARVGPP